jgi:hypothetical protein
MINLMTSPVAARCDAHADLLVRSLTPYAIAPTPIAAKA